MKRIYSIPVLIGLFCALTYLFGAYLLWLMPVPQYVVRASGVSQVILLSQRSYRAFTDLIKTINAGNRNEIIRAFTNQGWTVEVGKGDDPKLLSPDRRSLIPISELLHYSPYVAYDAWNIAQVRESSPLPQSMKYMANGAVFVLRKDASSWHVENIHQKDQTWMNE